MFNTTISDVTGFLEENPHVQELVNFIKPFFLDKPVPVVGPLRWPLHYSWHEVDSDTWPASVMLSSQFLPSHIVWLVTETLAHEVVELYLSLKMLSLHLQPWG